MLKTSGFKYATIEATNAFTSKAATWNNFKAVYSMEASVTSVVELEEAELIWYRFSPIKSCCYFAWLAHTNLNQICILATQRIISKKSTQNHFSSFKLWNRGHTNLGKGLSVERGTFIHECEGTSWYLDLLGQEHWAGLIRCFGIGDTDIRLQGLGTEFAKAFTHRTEFKLTIYIPIINV